MTYHGGAVERVLELRGYDTVVWEDFVNALPGYGFTVCEDCFNALTFKGLDEDIRSPAGFLGVISGEVVVGNCRAEERTVFTTATGVGGFQRI